ncbi:hypothetical protein C0Q70_00965 [Pomacea canaliculata]|uniref:Uncharacterized protein n=1 Tax=Pomacea canaliculata TaxID=400727 RepID=A0A2T7PY47_POMCA|nr:hypothetical protein C0Q70_00965 [Pomacea canaliculata]
MAGEVVDRWDDDEEDHPVRDSSLVDKPTRVLLHSPFTCTVCVALRLRCPSSSGSPHPVSSPSTPPPAYLG